MVSEVERAQTALQQKSMIHVARASQHKNWKLWKCLQIVVAVKGSGGIIWRKKERISWCQHRKGPKELKSRIESVYRKYARGTRAVVPVIARMHLLHN